MSAFQWPEPIMPEDHDGESTSRAESIARLHRECLPTYLHNDTSACVYTPVYTHIGTDGYEESKVEERMVIEIGLWWYHIETHSLYCRYYILTRPISNFQQQVRLYHIFPLKAVTISSRLGLRYWG